MIGEYIGMTDKEDAESKYVSGSNAEKWKEGYLKSLGDGVEKFSEDFVNDAKAAVNRPDKKTTDRAPREPKVSPLDRLEEGLNLTREEMNAIQDSGVLPPAIRTIKGANKTRGRKLSGGFFLGSERASGLNRRFYIAVRAARGRLAVPKARFGIAQLSPLRDHVSITTHKVLEGDVRNLYVIEIEDKPV